MATRNGGSEVISPRLMTHALSEVGDDAPSERVAANASEMLAEKVCGAMDVARGSGADDLNVVAFPVHLVPTYWMRWCLCDGVEICNGESKGRIGLDCAT
jgi:hypothetical protein